VPDDSPHFLAQPKHLLVALARVRLLLSSDQVLFYQFELLVHAHFLQVLLALLQQVPPSVEFVHMEEDSQVLMAQIFRRFRPLPPSKATRLLLRLVR